jgi:hypothetical protein
VTLAAAVAMVAVLAVIGDICKSPFVVVCDRL